MPSSDSVSASAGLSWSLILILPQIQLNFTKQSSQLVAIITSKIFFSTMNSHPFGNFNQSHISLQLWIFIILMSFHQIDLLSSLWWIFITVLNFNREKYSANGWSYIAVKNLITKINFHHDHEFSSKWWFFTLTSFNKEDYFLSQIHILVNWWIFMT